MRHRLLVGAVLAATVTMPAAASAQLSIGVSVRLAPPALPVYVQPPLPGPDYLWTPGYWAWDDDAQAYFWVPGTWVRAPRPGLLWTPPWWGWSNGLYLFHTGYWGPHIGFYGGVSYGFGYTGVGYQGGYWNGGHVFYNSTVTNVTDVHVTNVYQRNVTVNHVTRVSYNGGPGGAQARPGPQEQLAAHEQHVAPTGGQQAHFAAAHADPRAFASANHGRPQTMATARALGGPGASPAGARPMATGAAASPGRPTAMDRPQRFMGGPGQPGADGRAGGTTPDHPSPLAAGVPRAPDDRPMNEAPPHRPPEPHQAPHRPSRPHPQPKPPAQHPHPPAHREEEHR